jgi:NADH dehydrogenase
MGIKAKKIVILGAGFAGLATAKKLAKLVDDEIILIDRSPVHLYTPDLYEIAGSIHKKMTEECLVNLKESVASEIYSIIPKDKVEFIKAEVININPEKQIITYAKGKVTYDYLVLALGSVTNYYDIPGLEQFSYPVKTIQDAIVINCHLDIYFKELWKAKTKKNIIINIGGGGATGVEFGGEMLNYISSLCKKYHYPRNRVTLQLIQGSNELIGLGKEVSDIAKKRLESKGVKIIFNKYIKRVTPNKIFVQGKDEIQQTALDSDILIWTGGVKVNPVVGEAIEVDEYLRSKEHKNIFAAGDNAAFVENGKRVPMLAQVAWEEGACIADNIFATMHKKTLRPYFSKDYLAIIPLAGKFGIVKWRGRVFSGRWCWALRRLTDLCYALQILPFWKALKKWQHGNQVFVEND